MDTYLLVIGTIIAIAVIALFWNRIVDWFRGANRVRNEASGTCWGADAGTSVNVLRVAYAPAVLIEKCFCNLTRDARRTWQARNRWDTPACGIGDLLAFRIEFRNTGNTAIPAEEVRLRDDLTGSARLENGSVKAKIGDGEDIALPDDFIGREFSLSEIPGAPTELPANTSLYVRYKARVRGEEEAAEEAAEEETIAGPGPD
jgi:hypothetical protein